MFLSKLKRLHGEATEAPWEYYEQSIDFGYVHKSPLNGRIVRTVLFGESSEGAVDADNEDALLLVFLRNKAEAIIALVEAADTALSAIDAHDEANGKPMTDPHATRGLRAALSNLNAEES